MSCLCDSMQFQLELSISNCQIFGRFSSFSAVFSIFFTISVQFHPAATRATETRHSPSWRLRLPVLNRPPLRLHTHVHRAPARAHIAQRAGAASHAAACGPDMMPTVPDNDVRTGALARARALARVSVAAADSVRRVAAPWRGHPRSRWASSSRGRSSRTSYDARRSWRTRLRRSRRRFTRSRARTSRRPRRRAT